MRKGQPGKRKYACMHVVFRRFSMKKGSSAGELPGTGALVQNTWVMVTLRSAATSTWNLKSETMVSALFCE